MMAEDASFTQIERDQESGSRRRSKAEEAAIRKTAGTESAFAFELKMACCFSERGSSRSAGRWAERWRGGGRKQKTPEREPATNCFQVVKSSRMGIAPVDQG
jgi:hypothetical protein